MWTTFSFNKEWEWADVENTACSNCVNHISFPYLNISRQQQTVQEMLLVFFVQVVGVASFQPLFYHQQLVSVQWFVASSNHCWRSLLFNWLWLCPKSPLVYSLHKIYTRLYGIPHTFQQSLQFDVVRLLKIICHLMNVLHENSPYSF